MGRGISLFGMVSCLASTRIVTRHSHKGWESAGFNTTASARKGIAVWCTEGDKLNLVKPELVQIQSQTLHLYNRLNSHCALRNTHCCRRPLKSRATAPCSCIAPMGTPGQMAIRGCPLACPSGTANLGLVHREMGNSIHEMRNSFPEVGSLGWAARALPNGILGSTTLQGRRGGM